MVGEESKTREHQTFTPD
jgi:hypothetical protein